MSESGSDTGDGVGSAPLLPAGSTFLRSFYDLASQDGKTRQGGVVALLGHLGPQLAAAPGATNGTASSGGGGDSGSDSDGDVAMGAAGDDGDRTIDGDLGYALGRLVRGVCSSRQAARQGFAAALARVLASGTAVGVMDTVQRVLKATEVSAKLRGHEVRDLYFGRVFGLMAVVRSGRLARSGSEEAAAAKTVAEALLALLAAKRWLGDLVCECLLALCGQVPVGVLTGTLLPLVLDTLPDDAAALSVEHLHLALGLVRVGRAAVADAAAAAPAPATPAAKKKKKGKKKGKKKDAPAPLFAAAAQAVLDRVEARAELLSATTLPRILATLLESTRVFPRVHSCWLHAVSILTGANLTAVALAPGTASAAATAAAAAAADGDAFAEFWRVAVDEGLMGTSHDRSATGLALVQALAAAPGLTPGVASAALSARVFGCIRNNIGRRSNYLHQAARATVAALHVAAAASKPLAAALLSVFLSRGGPHFDASTHTRSVATLQASLDPADLAHHMALLRRVFADPLRSDAALGHASGGGDETGAGGGAGAGSGAGAGAGGAGAVAVGDAAQKSITARRTWALDTLCACCRSASLDTESDAVPDTIRFLTRHAFFAPSAAGSVTDDSGMETAVPVTSAMRDVVVARLHAMLDNLGARRGLPVAAPKGKQGKKGKKGRGKQAAVATPTTVPESANAAHARRRRFATLVHSVHDSLLSTHEPALRLSTAASAARTRALAAVTTLQRAADALGDDVDGHRRPLEDLASLLSHMAMLQLADPGCAAGAEDSDGDAEMGGSDGDDDEEGGDELTALIGDTLRCGFDLCRDAMIAAARAAIGSPPARRTRSRKGGKKKAEAAEPTPTGLDAAWKPIAWAGVAPSSVVAAEGVAAGSGSGDEEGGSGDEAQEAAPAPLVFVDVCLALLARPSSLVRDLVRSAFRSFCPMLTPQAIEVLLGAALSADTANTLAVQSDDEEEQAQEMTVMQDAVASGAFGESQTIDAAQLAALLAPDMDQGSDNDDEEDEGDDDEGEAETKGDDADGSGSDSDSDAPAAGDGARMDAMLANMIRLRQARKGRAKALKEQTLHFRFRVLELVEAAVVKLAGNPLLLEFPLPLLRCMRQCLLRVQQDRGAREAASILGRVRGILNRACKTKVPHVTPVGSPGVDPEPVHDMLEEALTLASKSGGTEFVAAVSNVLWMLLRALRAGGSMAERAGVLDEERVCAIYGNLLRSYMTAKNARLTSKVFIDLIGRAPFIAWQLGPILCVAASGESTPSAFRRREAFDMLAALLRQSSRGGAAVASLLPAVFTATTRTVEEAAAKSAAGEGVKLPMSAKRMKSVLDLAQTLLLKHSSTGGAEELRAAVAELGEKAAAKSLRSHCKRCLGVSKNKGAKAASKKAASKKGKAKGKGKKKSVTKRKREGDDGAAAAAEASATASAGAGAGAGKADKKSKKKKSKKTKKGKKQRVAE